MGKTKLDGFKDKLLSLGVLGLDSMCFIYQFANHPIYSPLTNLIFTLLDENKLKAVTSTITIVETFVAVERGSDLLTILEYEKTFQALPNLEIISIDWHVARLAAKLRATYSVVKTPDAIQIAAALLSNCQGFITNDNKLKQVKELKVVTFTDLG